VTPLPVPPRIENAQATARLCAPAMPRYPKPIAAVETTICSASERVLTTRYTTLPITMPAPQDASRIPKPASEVPRLSLA
jgi:hypothetical protein